MKILSLFNNKGGVGKTTLTFHFASVLAEMGYKVLMLDLDPQCNLSLFAMDPSGLEDIWSEENNFIDGAGFEASRKKLSEEEFTRIHSGNRTIHYLLKPTEEGTGEVAYEPTPTNIAPSLDLIPGRLTLHMYEYKISDRWAGAYQGDPLSIRTITRVREICRSYASRFGYDYVIVDTSPSLGALNKTIISTVDGFIVPNMPDAFSLYGIRNIGKALESWKSELTIIYQLISEEKRRAFPSDFVRFLGYTIYNARKYTGATDWDLSTAHYNYAQQIPEAILSHVPSEARNHLTDEMIRTPLGGKAIMHTHNTLPSMAQKYNVPMWQVPGLDRLESGDRSTVQGNRKMYEATRHAYSVFAQDVLNRLPTLEL